jgi:tetratricopeptide (TPR) repeat protein
MIRLFLLSIFLSGGLFADVLYSQGTIDSTALKSADQYISSGNYNEALVIYKDILFANPENLDIQEKKLNVLMIANREKEAYKDVEDLIRMYPRNPGYYYLRAILELKNEKFVKSVEDFDKSVELDMPKNYLYKVYLNRGMAHYYLQDFDLAEADFKSVIELDPQIAAAYHGLGMVKYEQKEYEDAVSEFQKSLKYDEKNSITHFNMAMSYYRLEEKDNACYHFNRSCALGNRNACKLLMMECAEDIKIPK